MSSIKRIGKEMWKGFLLVLILVLWGPSACAQKQVQQEVGYASSYLSGLEAKAIRIYREVLPTVVTVFTSRKLHGQQTDSEMRSIGSGVLISSECHVLTAAHVVDGASSIMVKTQDGELRPAELLFSEANADIALLKLVTPAPELEHSKLGDSDKLAVGQLTFVIGSPFGLENSFSVGHISAFRDFDRLYDGTIKAQFIQTDAAINSGNSGGPVFNSKGEVIGIASRIISRSGGFQGLGFVVAINTAKKLLALENRVWMGINGIYLNKEWIRRLLNHDLEGGFLIEHVAKGGPAYKAGLQGGTVPARILGRNFLLGGDLVIEFGAEKACNSECLVQAREHLKGLDKFKVKYLRGGKVRETVIDLTTSRQNFLKE